MSSSSEFSESSSGKVPVGRSSLNHRCNLLSQYLKQNGGFGDLSLGITDQGGETMGFFPNQKQIVKPMDLFPSESGFESAKEGVPKLVAVDNSSSRKAETAQMTIFYGGQVIVFDDFPADKAKEFMLLASRSSSQFFSNTVSDLTAPIPNNPSETTNAGDEPASVVLLPFARTPEPIACDLPLARRNSLHRFLEKRKDRITTRAPPYPKINGNNNITSADGSPLSKPVPVECNKKSWLSLSAQRY